jgi:hypothetical protein
MICCDVLRVTTTAGWTHLDAHGLHVHVIFHLTNAARGGQQGLGRDAAAVDAGATNVMALDHCNFHALQVHSANSHIE